MPLSSGKLQEPTLVPRMEGQGEEEGRGTQGG